MVKRPARKDGGHVDPLERAEHAMHELLDADDYDEPTGRQEVHVHLSHPSQPEIKRPLSVRPVVRDVLAVLRELPAHHRIIFALAALGVAASLAATGYVVFK